MRPLRGGFCTILVALSLAASARAQDELEILVKRLTDLYSIAEQNEAEPVSSEQAFYQGAIPGMLRRLDPHSVFFDPGQFEQLKQMQRSTQKGFGSVVSVLPGRVIFLQTLPGTPSAKSGISAGDEILAINGIPLAGLDLDQLIGLLTQSRQQQARLDVRRPGNARLLQFMLTPEEGTAPSVDRAFLLAPGVGYIRISNFENETGAQAREAIEKLGGAKLTGFVLDLRNNPGGVLPAAIEIASLFLKPGTKILSVRGRSVKGEEISVPEKAAPYDFPLAVLMNAKSASASEIVAGAIQDNDRGVIVGEPSFGKGLVQSVYPLSSATGIALTTAYYYTPSGRSIQRPLASGQLEVTADSAQEYLTVKGRKVKGGGGIQPDEVVYPEAPNRLRAVMEASGSFAAFATETVRRFPAITTAFEISPSLLDDFKFWLSSRNIRPSVSEWIRESDWVRFRLKEEIFNQALGVDKGDEVEAKRDPQVLKAVEAITK